MGVAEPLVEPKTAAKRRGRPWKDTRQVLEGVLWILRTGVQWAELPSSSVRALDIRIDPVEDGLNDLPLVGTRAGHGLHE